MKKYRYLINLGLIATLTIMTIVLFIAVFKTEAALTLQHYLGIVFTFFILITLFVNRNTFTLLLGITLVIGNFCGLSSLHAITTYSFSIGKIPLYWGQPEYTLMLLIHLLFNKDFYVGISTKEYWNEFTTRTNDLEPIIKPVIQVLSTELSTEREDEFKNRYSNYSTEKLIEITNDKRFIQVAQKAAAEIIADRQTKDTNELLKNTL